MRPILPWGVSLENRLRLQVLEFVVHADDLAVGLGRPAGDVPEAATNIAVDALMAAARFLGGDCAVIRAMARRERSAVKVFPVHGTQNAELHPPRLSPTGRLHRRWADTHLSLRRRRRAGEIG